MRSQMRGGLRFSARQCAVNTRVVRDESRRGGQRKWRCSEWSLITSLFILIDLVVFTLHSCSASFQPLFRPLNAVAVVTLTSKCTFVFSQ